MRARVDTPLKQVMRAEGRSQAWLARELTHITGSKVHRQQVWNWCNGIHEPADPTQAAIAQILRRQIAELWPTADQTAYPEAA